MVTSNQSAVSRLSREEAIALALAAANSNLDGREFVALGDRATEYRFGWVVFVVPRKYEETGEAKEIVRGIGPIAVERRARKVTFLSSSVPPARAIEEYQRRWDSEPQW